MMRLDENKAAANAGSKGRAAKTGQRKRINQAGRPTAAELERRKARVMEVATELFVTQGYSATSLVDIARGAGVATRTLYQHFGDKEAMFREVIFARDEGQALEQPTVKPGDSLFTALMRTADYCNSVVYRPKSIGLMRLMIAESTRFPEFMTSVATSIFARFRRNVEKVFIGLETNGHLPAADHSRSAQLFIDLIQGTNPIMVYTNWNAVQPSESDIAERVDLFILGRFGPETAAIAKSRTLG